MPITEKHYTTVIGAGDLIQLMGAQQTKINGPHADITDNQGLVILDCRAVLGAPEQGLARYRQGHITGAHHADLDRHLASPPGPGGRHPLPDKQQLARQLTLWGVGPATQIVAYDDAGGAFAARAWWCIRWLGHGNVAVLDGGLANWPQPLDAGEDDKEIGARSSKAAGASGYLPRRSLTRTIEAQEIMTGLTAQTLIDARTEARFQGLEEPIDPVAGHIPGALCLPFQGNLDASGKFLPTATLRQRFQHLPEELVCYCGSGVTAAHNILALVIAGRSEPKLYAGSWSEWIVDPNRPVASEQQTDSSP